MANLSRKIAEMFMAFTIFNTSGSNLYCVLKHDKAEKIWYTKKHVI